MPASRQSAPSNDGTSQLLRAGSLILAVGVIAIALLMTVFGGVGVEGAHSNPGWLALITGAMCLPFGLMLAALGAAKWLRNRSMKRNQ
jgi:uncharacterized membrane protein YidH (DUF202 family)